MRSPFAHSNKYLVYFAEGSNLTTAEGDSHLREYTHAGMEHMFLSLATIFKERFPENFPALDPENFVFPAASLAHHGMTEELERLKALVEGNCALQAAVTRGVERAENLRSGKLLQNVDPADNDLDLTQRPDDPSLIFRHK